MLALLAPVASAFALTEARLARAAPASALAREAEAVAPAVPRVALPDREAALAWALERSPVVAVAGSIFLVGDLRTALVARGALTED